MVVLHVDVYIPIRVSYLFKARSGWTSCERMNTLIAPKGSLLNGNGVRRLHLHLRVHTVVSGAHAHIACVGMDKIEMNDSVVG